jgi:hypothetical protein
MYLTPPRGIPRNRNGNSTSTDNLGQHTNLIGLHAVYRYRIAETFPVGSEASYSQISKTCSLSETQVRRILRYTMTKHLFTESRPGYVGHTAASKVLAESQSMRDWVGMVCEEMWPAAGRTVDAMVKWAGSEEPQHTVILISSYL